MDGLFYSGERGLLDFNERTDQGFVMSSENLIYGASCGFRVLDEERLAAKLVDRANERGDFPVMPVTVWRHASVDVEEVASLVYGERVFAGYVTRIELRSDARGRVVATVWGGHEGITVSKARDDSHSAISAFGRRVAWGGEIAKLLRP